MNEDTRKSQPSSEDKSSTWLSKDLSVEENDSVDEVIRSVLDEIRIA